METLADMEAEFWRGYFICKAKDDTENSKEPPNRRREFTAYNPPKVTKEVLNVVI